MDSCALQSGDEGTTPAPAEGLRSRSYGVGFGGLALALAAAWFAPRLALLLFLIGVAIALHEGGHAVVGARRGAGIDRFVVGMGPRLLWWQRGPVLFELRFLPFLGYVRFVGVGDEPVPAGLEHRRFRDVPRWGKVATTAAGPLVNLVLGLLVAVSVLSLSDPQPAFTVTNPPAASGLEDGDRVLSVGGASHAGYGALLVEKGVPVDSRKVDFGAAAMDVEVERDGVRVLVEDAGVFDTVLADPSRPSVVEAAGTSLNMLVWALPTTVSSILHGEVSQFALDEGPLDVTRVLLAFAWLHLSLGVLNLLPVPPLDGGRIALLGYEVVAHGRRLPSPARVTTVTVLVGLVVVVYFMFVHPFVLVFGR